MLTIARATRPLVAATALLAGALSLSGCVEKNLVGGTGGSAGSGGDSTSSGGSGAGGDSTSSAGGSGGSGGSGGDSTSSTGGSGAGGSTTMSDGWARAFGDAEHQVGAAIALDPGGNRVVIGSFQGSMVMDSAQLDWVPPPPPNPPGSPGSPWGMDVFVVKLDASGAVLWAKSWGNGHKNSGYDVAVDPDGNIVMTGAFVGPMDFGGGPIGAESDGNNIFVVKLDPNGQHLWSKTFGDSAYQPQFPSCKVETDGSGNIVLGGQYMGGLDFGGGPLSTGGTTQADLYVAKLDGDGHHLWSKRFGDTDGLSNQSERLHALTVDAQGNVQLCGDMGGTLDFGGGDLASDGGAFAARLDANGNHVWSRVYGEFGASFTAQAVTPQGHVVLAGYFSDLVDFGTGPLLESDGGETLVELDGAGDLVSARQWDGPIWVEAMAASASGKVALVGRTNATIDMTKLGGVVWNQFEDASNPVIVLLDTDGSLLASKVYDLPSIVNFPDREPAGAVFDAQGYLAVTGYFEGDLDLGYGTLSGGERPNLFVARLPQSLAP